VSLFGQYEFGAPEMATLRAAVVDELLQNRSMTRRQAASWGDALSFHHQWMVLSREHAAALVHHRRDIIKVGVVVVVAGLVCGSSDTQAAGCSLGHTASKPNNSFVCAALANRLMRCNCCVTQPDTLLTPAVVLARPSQYV
jgi:hypothetical protein